MHEILGAPWFRKTAFLLGGGPSVTPDTLAKVKDRLTIAVNSTALVTPWARYLFFGDWTWFRDHRPLVNQFAGRCITTCRRAAQIDRRLVLVEPPVVQPEILSAGHHAVDVAMALGAARIVLMGYDCRTIAGRSHCHNDYPRQWAGKFYADAFLPAWEAYPARAAARGVEILNATPGSAIEAFPSVDLDMVR